MSVEPITFGQGSYGYRCSVCGADDYDGALVHRAGCSAPEPVPASPEPEAIHIYRVTFADGAEVLTGATNRDELYWRFPDFVSAEDVTPA